jgi:uncharacterized Rmd1/YagE family protein
VGGELLPIRAYAFAATLQPKVLDNLLPADATRVKLTKTIAVARLGASGWIVAHDFGAIVFLGVEEPTCARLMKKIVAEIPGETRAPLEETYSVQVMAGSAPAVRFDRVVVPELDGRVVEIVALVVAQSVAMEYYEGDVDSLVAALEERSDSLARDGTLYGSARALLRFVGQGMSMRTQVVHTLSLLESPSATWDDESLDRVYRGLRASFEIEERYRSLDHELRIVQDNLELMVDLMRQRRFILLEVLVAVFVGAELLVLLGQLLLGWHAAP